MGNRQLSTAVIGVILVASACSGSGSADTRADTSATDPPGEHDGPVRVIFDYSPTLSDVSTLMYLTQHPDVELLAVTLAGTGESHCEQGVSNTIGLLELAGLPDVPVACGQTTPIGPGNEWPAEWRERSDALVGLTLPAGRQGADIDAADLMAEVAAAQDDPVTLVAVGPLTNIADALQRHGDFDDDVARIVTMGGAFDVSGNAPNRSAEWNYFIDPLAVEFVFDSGVPITVVPLDATNDVPVTYAWFGELSLHHTTAAATAVYDLLSATPGWELGFSFWDELAAAVVVDPTLVTFEDRSVVVVTTGERAGRTRTDADGVTVRVAMSADARRFEHELLTGLNAGVEAPARVDATAEQAIYFETLAASRAAVEDGIGRLFESPEANAVEEFMSDEPAELTPEQEQALRAFFGLFWSGAIDLIAAHADELTDLDVPADLTSPHERYAAALRAIEASEPERQAALDDLHGEELMAFLWTTDADIEAVDTSCEALQLEAVIRSVDVVLCPN